jgi:hypothetical protein
VFLILIEGQINEHDYVLSRIYYSHDGLVAFVSCERCVHGHLPCDDMADSNCAHSVLLRACGSVINAASSSEQIPPFSDAFLSWMAAQAKSGGNIVLLKRRGQHQHFLVIAEEEVCLLDKSDRLGRCIVQATEREIRVRCISGACIANRKGKSTVKKNKHDEQACIHIRVLTESTLFRDFTAQNNSVFSGDRFMSFKFVFQVVYDTLCSWISFFSYFMFPLRQMLCRGS